MLKDFFALQHPKKINISISEERKQWFKQFIKAFAVVFFVYFGMYLIRNNIKAATPLLVEKGTVSTTQIGIIGLAFSITYGIGKTLMSTFVDGHNAKRMISFFLIISAFLSLIFGIVLLTQNATTGVLLAIWGLNGLFQSPGGPASYSTISRWTPETKRGRWLGFWNTSHNIGGGLAGLLALWGANHLFNGNVAGMFIFPAFIVIIIGLIGLFLGKDEPEELGWDSAPVIFDETESKQNKQAESMTKMEILKQFVIKNPWVWVLSIANVFVYIVRIGIDNWAPLYSVQALHMNNSVAVSTIFYFEMGALLGSLSWGWISDLLKGRRIVVALVSVFLQFFVLHLYSVAHSKIALFVALFIMGWLVFGPQLLIGVSVVGFVPKQALSVANGLTGTFAYLFGDSLAKVGLGYIADPKSSGLKIFGTVLHGWQSTFIVMYIALVIAAILLIFVAFAEERKIKLANKN
ncbi:MAG: hexose-6-phosphate:phosphate antiporter [Lactobacillaceae bacterium]|jgi:OPA family hexose phosphate transport protein UhpT-like MFS transporter|nr:hexose-6-phosphate:phosphate antiporter [Lactobacillaceae bacterium]